MPIGFERPCVRSAPLFCCVGIPWLGFHPLRPRFPWCILNAHRWIGSGSALWCFCARMSARRPLGFGRPRGGGCARQSWRISGGAALFTGDHGVVQSSGRSIGPRLLAPPFSHSLPWVVLSKTQKGTSSNIVAYAYIYTVLLLALFLDCIIQCGLIPLIS